MTLAELKGFTGDKLKAQAFVVQNNNWQSVAEEACAKLAGFGQLDLLFLFASDSYASYLPDLVKTIYRESGASTLLGCASQTVIGENRELEDEVAISLLALSLPDTGLRTVYLTQNDITQNYIASLPGLISSPTGEVNAWILFSDPFTIASEQMLTQFSAAFPGIPLVGGVASGDFRLRRSYLFMNDQVLHQGALALAISGALTVDPVVSQGATPVGEAWMVTAADGPVIESISGRPAYELLVDTIKSLPLAQQQRVARNFLVGLAVDEYKAEFGRGDFLIRNLTAIDPQSGAIAINAEPRIGQTIQFQMRDAEAADEDLRGLLAELKTSDSSHKPLAGILFSCNGRGTGLFGVADHDATTIKEQLGAFPLSGFFCNGEFGPIGKQNFVHGFTASLGLFVPKDSNSGKH